MNGRIIAFGLIAASCAPAQETPQANQPLGPGSPVPPAGAVGAEPTTDGEMALTAPGSEPGPDVIAVTPGAGQTGPNAGDVIAESEDVEIPADAGTEKCAGFSEQANQVILSVDIVFVIDNSSSMSEEITEVQARINSDFAGIIEASGLDYSVLMISRYGDVTASVGQSDFPICVGPPLGATDCATAATAPLANNAPIFHHYSSDVGSLEPWCDVIDGFSASDEHGGAAADRTPAWTPLFPTGYSAALRPESFKHFVVITDDNSNCGQFGGGFGGGGGGQFGGGGGAAQFDTALLALSPEYFGTAAERRYRWHSIVGMTEKTAAAGATPEPWYPDEPVGTELCTGVGGDAVGAGTAFQDLSILTGGLRYSSCRTDNFDAVFNAIAEGIVQGATLSCEWDIPPAPENETFDKEKVNVEFTPGDGESELLGKVAGQADCGTEPGWYFDNEDAPTVVRACPASCDVFAVDGAAAVSVVFGCETKQRIAR